MSLPPVRPPSAPAILWLAVFVVVLVASLALWPTTEPVHFRTGPFISGHGAETAAEFVFSLAPPLA
ncbi:hypothetical protein V5740_13735 [Croceibacterium sp. TMG7-5b_MA50]|uniref:hypothetical protein n=1 Tax=Croceibacterium sp. TMG7-5b_MA50 TaxID=3121290 RepID=UPI00322199D0